VRSSEIRDLSSRITAGASDDVDRVRRVHDWIILNTAYDLEAPTRRHVDDRIFRMTGVVRDGKAVCLGYARAALELLRAARIDCELITNDDHAWNLVRIGSRWYHLDVTHDDPTPDEPGRVVYDHFLVSTELISKTRPVPPCPDAPVDYFATISQWQGVPLLHRSDQIARTFDSLLTSRGSSIRLLVWRAEATDVQRIVVECFRDRGAAGRLHISGTHMVVVEVSDLSLPDHRRAPSPDRSAPAARPLEATLVLHREDGGILLDRESARERFPDLRDRSGRVLFELFPPDPILLIRWSPRWSWWACAPAVRKRYVTVDGIALDCTPRSLRHSSRLVVPIFEESGSGSELHLALRLR
jgi:hypothetical protein